MASEDPNKTFMKKMLKIRNKLLNIKTMEEIGEKAADMVRERTRLGKGLTGPDSNKGKKLEKLSTKYKRYRKLHPGGGPTTPAKSNLTYTGDMLDDIDYKVEGEKKKGRTIEIGIYDDESKQKAEWVTEGGRSFMGLTTAQIKELKIFIGRNLRKFTK